MGKFLIFAIQPLFWILLSDSIHSRVFNGFVMNFQDEGEFLAHCLPETLSCVHLFKEKICSKNAHKFS